MYGNWLLTYEMMTIKRAGTDKHVQTDTPANNETYTHCIYFMFPPSVHWQNTVSAAQTVDI